MISKETSLNPKKIKGKKIRLREFYMSLIYPMILLYFPISGVIMQLSWDTMRILLIMLFCFLPVTLLLPLLLWKKVLCILADDRLYFFKAEVIELYSNSIRKKRTYCDGSVCYSEIRNFEYIAPVRSSIFSKPTQPSQVVFYGAEFQLTIQRASKGLIKKVKAKQGRALELREIQDALITINHIKPTRSGLWNEIWCSYENSAFEELFDSETDIFTLENDDVHDSIKMTVSRNGHDISFHIDEETLFMYSYDNDIDKTVSLGDIADLESFFALMQNFVFQNS